MLGDEVPDEPAYLIECQPFVAVRNDEVRFHDLGTVAGNGEPHVDIAIWPEHYRYAEVTVRSKG